MTGRNAQLLFDLWSSVAPLLHGVVNLHGVTHQLHQVLVAGDDGRFDPLRYGLPHQRGDDIVRLITGKLRHGDVKGLHNLPHDGELRFEVLGSRRPIRLVLRVDGLPELAGILVHGHSNHALGIRPQRLEQHECETIGRADGQSRLRGQRRQCVIGPKDTGASVNENNFFAHSSTLSRVRHRVPLRQFEQVEDIRQSGPQASN